MLARAALVLGEGIGEVLARLPADLRHPVGRVGVAVLGDAVAAHAGVGERAAFLDRGLRRRGGGGFLGSGRERQCGKGEAGGELQRSHHVVIRIPVWLVGAWRLPVAAPESSPRRAIWTV